MLKRLKAWHILTAGLIGLVPACGSGADEVPEVKQVPIETRQARELPTMAKRDADLAETKPMVPVGEEKVEKVVSHEELLDSLTLAAERKQDDVKLRIKLARALYDAGKYGEARKHAEIAVEVEPESGAAWYMMGRIEMAARDLDAAIAAFQQSVEADPENSYAWNNLGYSLIEQQKWDEAAAALENATGGAKPTDYMWNNLGMAYEHLDRIREARAAYRQAAELGSTKGQANLDRLEGVTSLVPAAVEPEPEVEVEVEETVTPVGGNAAGGADDEPQDELGC
jgi:tetratricopeptide (TPR) repeat protein